MGISAVLADRPVEDAPEGLPIVMVPNCLELLGQLASAFYGGWGGMGEPWVARRGVAWVSIALCLSLDLIAQVGWMQLAGYRVAEPTVLVGGGFGMLVGVSACMPAPYSGHTSSFASTCACPAHADSFDQHYFALLFPFSSTRCGALPPWPPA